MQQLPETAISAWIPSGPRSHPSVVGGMCANCRKNVSFSVSGWQTAGENNWHASSQCPICRSAVQFFTMNVGTGFNSLCGGSLFIFPAPQARVPNVNILNSHRLSESLKRAYQSGFNVIQIQEWNSVAVNCRRLLEGITKAELPPELHRGALAKQIEALPMHVDLGKPLLELASAVRKGGNLGAHFTLEPTEEVATLMLDLCEDLIEYLYVLPEQINELNLKLAALANTAASDDA